MEGFVRISDAELLGVVSSLTRIARTLVRERRHLRHLMPLMIYIIAYLAIWVGIS
jgi:hypothetical protein